MRDIYTVDATQVVTSDAHPEGLFSHISGYPKTFDSRNYNATEENPDGDPDRALRVAKAEYFSALSTYTHRLPVLWEASHWNEPMADS